MGWNQVRQIENFEKKICSMIAKEEPVECLTSGEFEVNGSSLDSRIKGKWVQCPANEVPVLGILKRSVKVWTQMIYDAKGRMFLPIIKDRFRPTLSHVQTTGTVRMSSTARGSGASESTTQRRLSVVPHAGICPGGHPKRRSLSRPLLASIGWSLTGNGARCVRLRQERTWSLMMFLDTFPW